MSKKKAIKKVTLSCPICRVKYQTPELEPAPTCGNPNCIREARARGMPFTAPRRRVSENSENLSDYAKDRLRKIRS